jgi:hypothetical protein
MGNETPQKVPEQSSTPVEQNFFEALFDENVIGPILESLISKNPELAKEHLSIGRDFVMEDGQIDRQAFLKEQSLQDKIGALIGLWLSDNFISKQMDKIESIDPNALQISSFEEAKEKYSKDNKTGRVVDNNILLNSKGSAMSMLADMLLKKNVDAADVKYSAISAASPFVSFTGSSFVVERNKSNLKYGTIFYKSVLKKRGIDLKVYNYDEIIPEPGEKEVQIVVMDSSILPTKERPSFDSAGLEKCRKLFERGKVVWDNPLLTAAILKLQGKSSEEALVASGINATDDIKKLLDTVGQPEPVTPTVAVAPAAPAAAPAAVPTAVPAAQQTVQTQVAQATTPAAPGVAPAATPVAPAAIPTPITNPATAPTQAPAQKAA